MIQIGLHGRLSYVFIWMKSTNIFLCTCTCNLGRWGAEGFSVMIHCDFEILWWKYAEAGEFPAQRPVTRSFDAFRVPTDKPWKISMIFQWYFKTKITNFNDNYKRYKTEKHRTTCYTWSLHTSYDYHWVFLRKSGKSSYSPNEECVKQHYMVLCDFSANIMNIPRVKKRKFSPRIWTWKLRDPTTAILSQSAFKVKTMTAAAAVVIASGADADTANHVESAWSKLKGPLLDAATEVCSISKNHQWKPETRWWNEEVDKAIYTI